MVKRNIFLFSWTGKQAIFIAPKMVRRRINVTALFETSSVTGVKEIITVKSLSRKLVKILIIVASLAGFIFQTYEFLRLYWQYSTVPSVSPLDNMKMPAITICDQNLIRRIYFCEVYKPSSCDDYKDEEELLCKQFPDACVDENDIYYMIPYPNLVYDDKRFDLHFTEVAGFLIEKSIISCEWFFTNSAETNSDEFVTTNCSQPKFVRGINEDRLTGACYTLESAIGQSDYKAKSFDYAGLTLILKWRNADLFDMKQIHESEVLEFQPPRPPRVYYVSVHSATQLSNPFFDGFQVEQRKEYEISVSQVDQERLPPPYSTKCFDYMTVWKENGGEGPVTRDDCIAECEIQVTFENLTCVPRDVSYPHNMTMCAKRPAYDIDLFMKIQDCTSKCRDACQETKYEVEIDVLRQVSDSENIKRYGTQHVVSIDFEFISNSTKTVYMPKYEEEQLFSYIGGLLGMWLGWSFLAIFDLFEIAAWTLKHLFRDKRSKARK